MSIPTFQFPPPLPFPPWHPYICSRHLFLYFCFPKKIIYTIFYLSHICINIEYLLFSFTSLCMTLSSSIHMSTKDPIKFLFMVEYYSIVYMYRVLEMKTLRQRDVRNLPKVTQLVSQGARV